VVKVKDKGSKKMVDKVVLAGLTGVIAPGRLTAIMGASGAGKSSFLNVLVRQARVCQPGGRYKHPPCCATDSSRCTSGPHTHNTC
jgi:ABC-type lipoprotein export system ATPase subunit